MALSTLSGALLGFSFDGDAGDHWFALLALAPLVWLVFASGLNLIEALTYGWWAGTVGWGLACYWVPGSFAAVANSTLLVGVSAWFALSVWHGGIVGLFTVLLWAFRRVGASAVLAAPVALVLAEWALPVTFEHHLGASLHNLTNALQLASLGGPLLLSAITVLTSACLVDIVRGLTARNRPYLPVVVLVVAWSAALAWGASQRSALATRVEASPSVLVGVVQENLSPSEKHANPRDDIRRYWLRSRELLVQHEDVGLLIWPETVVGYRLDESLERVGSILPEELGTPLLFGGYRRETRSGHERIYNSAFLVDGNGEVAGAYDKQKLFPFSEKVPLLSIINRLTASPIVASPLAPGDAKTITLQLGEVRIGTLICYDEMFASLVRKAVRAGASLLVSLSNDAWFGESHVASQHLALSKLRAVEAQRALVRSTNTGATAVVGADGRVLARAPDRAVAQIVFEVPLLEDHTPYVRWGNWLGVVALVAAAALMVRGALRSSGR